MGSECPHPNKSSENICNNENCDEVHIKEGNFFGIEEIFWKCVRNDFQRIVGVKAKSYLIDV